MSIPNKLNPFGINKNKGILGYAPGAYAFWDGLNNQGLGQHNTSATTWADLSENGLTLVKVATANENPIWANDGGITGDGTAKARGFRTNDVILDSQFTVEVCLRKSANTFNCWWWNNRNPWTQPSPFGFQCATYSALKVYIQAFNNDNTVLLNISETASQQAPAFETVAHSYDGTTLRMYRSGTFFSSADVNIPIDLIKNTPFLVNGSVNNSAVLSLRYEDSRLYAIRVYHRVLTQSELTKNFNLDNKRFNSN